MASDAQIVLEVVTAGVEKVVNLSNALQQLNKTVEGAKDPMRNLDARARALSQAIGSSDSSLKNHAKSVGQLTRNQAVLSNELGRVTKELKGLGKTYQFATGTSKAFSKEAVADLRAYQKALSGIKARALVEDLKSIAQEQKRLGKDAQFVGRSLIIGLTTPIVGFARYGLQALTALDEEFTRLNKVLENIAPNIDKAAKKTGIDLANATGLQRQRLQQMVDNYNALDKSLTKISNRFGIAKSLTVGLAGDFAELGIQVQQNITDITDLTAATEKLGGMDIGQAKDLVQALYFQARRTMELTGESRKLTASQVEAKAIAASKAQLALFNIVENQTALTLKDLGDAFPEVSAAATTFGLSMTEAAAMLAPMKAAGFEVGASANSIKVSLQRIVAPTKQNKDLLKSLANEYKVDFTQIKGSGLEAIQALIDGYNEIATSAAGLEGVTELFSRLFGVRQGPRMQVAIGQLATLDRTLKDTSASSDMAEKQIQAMANSAISSANRTLKVNIPLIKSYKDIGVIARLATAQVGEEVEGMTGKVTNAQIEAAKGVRNAVSDLLLSKSQKEGIDLIGQVGTEAGKAMFVELAGVKNAQAVADRELETALGTLNTSITRIKNNLKAFATDLINTLRPTIEKISETVGKMVTAWQNLDSKTKAFIAKLITGVLAATAAIGPLVFVFGQFRLAMGTIGKVMFGFLPGLKTMAVDSVAAGSGLLRLTNPLKVVGDTAINTNGAFATLLATLANTETPIGRLANRLGLLTGKLQAQSTAPMTLRRAINARKGPAGTVGIVSGTGALEAVPQFVRYNQFVSTEEALKAQTGLGVTRTGSIFTKPGGLFSRKGATGAQFLPKSTLNLDDFNEIINKRLDALLGTKVRIGETGAEIGKKFFTPKFGGEVELSEKRALRLARGGVSGRLERARIGGTGAITAAVGGIKSMPTKAVASYTAAIAASRAATKALTIETIALSGSTPGRFALMKASVMGFAKSFKSVDKAIKLMKMAMISSGIGALLLAIGVAIVIVKNNMDKFKQAGASGMKVLKDAFNIIKNAALEIVRPIMDLFAHFGKGGQGAQGAAEGIGVAFNKLAGVLKFVANLIKTIVEKFIKPFLYEIINIVAAVVSAFQGKWKQAFKYLVAAAAFGMEVLINIIATAMKIIITIISKLTQATVSLFGWMLKKIADGFFAAGQLIVNALGWLPFGIGDKIKAAYKNVKNATHNMINTVTGGINGAINSSAKATNGLIDRTANNLKKKMKGLKSGGIDASTGQVSLGGKKPKVEVDASKVQEEIADKTGKGFEEGADAGAQKVAAKLKKVLVKELQEDIASRIKTSIEGVVDTLTDALKQQKEDSLKIYDDQLEKIDDLKRAEEELTKTKEYENKKRELEDKRALNTLNYIREKALAIYEGRIDDARELGLKHRKDEIDSNKELADLTTARDKELKDAARENLIDSIKDAKQAASNYFDDMIKMFTDAAKKITEFPPTTAEEFKTQLGQLTDKAKEVADLTGTKFTSTFTGLLGNLGVDAEAPLTTALKTISDTLINNNPFGPEGVWQKAIDASIEALTKKYQGLTNTLNTVVDDSTEQFKNLFDIYKNYQELVSSTEGTGVGGGNGAGGGTGTGNTATGGTGSLPGWWYKFKERGEKKWSAWAGPFVTKAYIESVTTGLAKRGTLSVKEFLGDPNIGGGGGKGRMTARYFGGLVPKPSSQSVPALLHGGEFVVNAKAVNNIGLAALQQMNAMRFAVPGNVNSPNVGSTYHEQNININVDTFIGEQAWFESMMKDYNIKIAPKNQKTAGLENRKISTYTGINRGM